MKSIFAASAAAIAFAASSSFANVLINEIQPNPAGSDPSQQTVELLGEANTEFSVVLLSIESDNTSSKGTVDRLSTLSGNFDANGIFTADITDLENPSNTLILLDAFTGSIGDDLDTDNDGTIDVLTDFGNVLDAVGIIDNPGDTNNFATQFGGTELGFIGGEPILIFREGNTQEWFSVDFSEDIYDALGNLVTDTFAAGSGAPTFGLVNPIQTAAPVPVPAAALLFAPAALLLRRRAR
ncbi:MAG: hypothetical protein AAF830_03180 [Pseudomonadota bacterium]